VVAGDLTRPEVPKIESKWVRTPIDAFIWRRCRKPISAIPEADRRTLIRASHTVACLLRRETSKPRADKSADAYEKLSTACWLRPPTASVGPALAGCGPYRRIARYDKDKPRLNACRIAIRDSLIE